MCGRTDSAGNDPGKGDIWGNKDSTGLIAWVVQRCIVYWEDYDGVVFGQKWLARVSENTPAFRKKVMYIYYI